MMTNQPAAGPWRTDEPPKDGKWFLVHIFDTHYQLVFWSARCKEWLDQDGDEYIRTEILAWAEIMPYKECEDANDNAE